MTADKQHLYLHLYSGEQFENLKSQNMNQRNVPYRRETFRESMQSLSSIRILIWWMQVS